VLNQITNAANADMNGALFRLPNVRNADWRIGMTSYTQKPCAYSEKFTVLGMAGVPLNFTALIHQLRTDGSNSPGKSLSLEAKSGPDHDNGAAYQQTKLAIQRISNPAHLSNGLKFLASL
jgi:hypothetical protein